MKKKIIVAISGGVDSAVAAQILLEQENDLIGVFFKNFLDKNSNYQKKAEAIAKKLKIPFFVFDFTEKFFDQIYQPFLEKIKKGITPNPCILCNKNFKFGIFMDHVLEKFSTNFFATGHYAKIENKKNDYFLYEPKDHKNDQTYFLHQLTAEQLKKIIFPLSNLTKEEVRKKAKKNNIKIFSEKSSTDICFLEGQKFSDFLEKKIKIQKGEIIDIDTKKILGTHKGINFYTIGQRKNLGIGGVKNFPEEPFFVIKKNLKKNILWVSQNKEHQKSNILYAKDIFWINKNLIPKNNFFSEAKIRFRTQKKKCQIFFQEKNTIKVVFEEQIFSATPGQYVVFYKDGVCLGGGEIELRI